jgi:diguanylate cyclase (GGDEF)-like protein
MRRRATRDRRAERANGEERFRHIVERSSDVVLLVGPGLVVEYQSSYAFGSASVVGEYGPLSELFHRADAVRVTGLLEELARQPNMIATIGVRVRAGDGTWIDVEATFTNLLEEECVHAIVVNLRDIRQRVTLEEQLRRQALHDPLTGLPNRLLFRDRLEHALARARESAPLALLFFDLDRFKAINDSLGHAVGDELLIVVADRLGSIVRAGETIARFGGDEFAILIEEIQDPADASWVANRIVEELGAPVILSNTEVAVSASVGIAFNAGARGDAEELLRNADVAMYAAKSRGGGCYAIFEPHMQIAVRERLELENDLRGALGRNEMFVQYQPLVDLESSVLMGVEALVRWRHPTRGVLQPEQFIPLAEVSGLIVPIGAFVLERACRQVQQWQARSEADPPLKLSVNLSARQLQYDGLTEDVRRALHRSALDPSQLVLELTETSLLGAEDLSALALVDLKNLGISIAIDDFGTGYSSLSYLQRLPVDILKIDRSFVSGAEPGGKHTRWALAQTVVQLATSLGLTTTAEGIENREQWEALVAMGCQTGQGFHFAHPVDAFDIEALLMADQERVRPKSTVRPFAAGA